MRKYLLLFLSVLFGRIGICQNLVINPSFEDTVSCPIGLGQIHNAVGWSSYGATPDYMNACADETSGLSVPLNTFGYQYAFDGNAYANLGTYTQLPNVREFIAVELLQPLAPGVKYFLSCYISRCETANATGASNNFGFRFTNLVYSQTNPMPADNFSHVHSDSIITDQLNWVRIAGSFIADSVYEYLVIGNFYDDQNTDTIDCPYDAAYYVDAVCVSPDSLSCTQWDVTNEPTVPEGEILPYPNPVNDIIHLGNVTGRMNYTMINSLGQIILSGNLYEGDSEIDVSSCAAGMYFLKLAEAKFKKISIIHY